MKTIQPARVLTAAGMALAGAAMVVMSIVTDPGGGREVAELAEGASIIFFALILFGTGLVEDRPMPTSLPTGILTILGSLLYLGTALPEFHRGAVTYPEAIVQFVSVLSGLFVGASAFALREPAVDFRRGKRMYPTTVAPDGVILVVGTILLGLGIGETSQPHLTPPTWNWVSFAGIAIPAMLLLIPVRGMVKAMLHRERLRGRMIGPLGLFPKELLLVVGLGGLLYGFHNVFAGTNGYETGFHHDPAGGIAVWAGAALFLIAVRGGFKLTLPERLRDPLSRALPKELLLAIGLAGFIYGERWVLTGSHLTVASTGAGFAASGILIAGVLLLIPIRIAAKRVHRDRGLAVIAAQIAELEHEPRVAELRRLHEQEAAAQARRLAEASKRLPADLAMDFAEAQAHAQRELADPPTYTTQAQPRAVDSTRA